VDRRRADGSGRKWIGVPAAAGASRPSTCQRTGRCLPYPSDGETWTNQGVIDSSSTSSASIRALAAEPSDDIHIDSPPVSGFVPHIVVAVTDKASTDDDWVAQTEYSVTGRYLTDRPEVNYALGLFDTGAGLHVMGHGAAERAGIFAADRVTDNQVELLGATHSVFAPVSYPLAIFVDGLAAIDPNGMLLDDSHMVGQSNVAIVVGDEPPAGRPDLPTVIGSPLSVNFVTAIHNDRQITVTYDGNEYTGPEVRFYDFGDSRIPAYPSYIPLNLIPAGGVNIQYIPDLEAIFELIFEPGQPSIIVGNSAQSLFFVDSVDLHNGTRSALDKRRFMLDTGAQVTVIGSGIGSRLGLNPAQADFEVEIQDITGEITMEPAFFIDSLEIPALGSWISYSNVPVVMMDIGSPEGGYLEGIIGMNLFVEFDLVLRGGGLLGLDMPSLEFARITLPPVGDIAPGHGDGKVDALDLAALAAAWLSSSGTPGWNPRADLAPRQLPDGIVDNQDFSVFAACWRQSVTSSSASQ
jgi:predicted aspartyl protease